MSTLFRFAAVGLAVSYLYSGASAYASGLPPVEAAQLQYDVQSSAGPNVSANGNYTGPVARADGNWAFRIEGEPRTLIRFNDRASVDPDLREDQTTFFANLIYHFRLNASSQEAYDAALTRGSLTFDGFTDFFETGGIQTLVGNANISLFSVYNFDGPRTIAFGRQVGCNRFSPDGCGRQDFSAALSLTDFADPTTLSFGGTISLFADYQAPRVGAAGAFRSLRIDPVLGLVGSGLTQSNYSFEFSPGIGNGAVAAVPEPTSWAFMLVGFGIVGYGLRRRSKASNTAATVA